MDARSERFIERMGLLSEADGLPRIAGRIFGYLFLTAGECSLEEIAGALQVSRASVSTDARRLAQIGVIERRGRPGDRRDYYAMSPTGVRHSIENRIRSLRQFHEVLEGAQDLGIASPDVRRRIAAWDTAHALLVAAFTGVLTELDAAGSAGD